MQCTAIARRRQDEQRTKPRLAVIARPFGTAATATRRARGSRHAQRQTPHGKQEGIKKRFKAANKGDFSTVVVVVAVPVPTAGLGAFAGDRVLQRVHRLRDNTNRAKRNRVGHELIYERGQGRIRFLGRRVVLRGTPITARRNARTEDAHCDTASSRHRATISEGRRQNRMQMKVDARNRTSSHLDHAAALGAGDALAREALVQLHARVDAVGCGSETHNGTRQSQREQATESATSGRSQG